MGHIYLKRGSNGEPDIRGVEHNILRHSPDGFEYGYGGSGPAELALNILDLYCDEDERDSKYQAFKWDVISRLDQNEDHVLREEEIFEWLEETRNR